MTTSADERNRTMSLRALRRLSTCELRGLGIALDELETLEAALVADLPTLRKAAEKEANVRHARGLHPAGPYVAAWSGVRRLIEALGSAREETSYVAALERVPRRSERVS